MDFSKGLAAAFADGPANPDHPEEAERFYQQAYWLSECSKLVYPPDGSEEGTQDYERENELDREAELAKRAYRKLRPWWKVLSTKNEVQKKAEKAWQDAEGTWAETAEARIRDRIRSMWSPEGEALPEEFEVEFISCIGTQYFIARDDKTIVVCFRGTEMKKRWDILTDLISIQTSDSAVHTGRIHLGFWTALDHVWGDVEPRVSGDPLSILLGADSLRNKGQKVWFTGHSLGGALATLAADRALVSGVLDEEAIGGVVTFGQPRVGDKAFSSDSKVRTRQYRFINNNDVVPRVPPRSLALAALVLGTVCKGAARQEGGGAKSTMSYGDSGRIIFLDRSGALQLMPEGFLKWRVDLFAGRAVSRCKALFRHRGFMNRVFPGLPDHGMVNYRDCLKNLQSADLGREEKDGARSATVPEGGS